MSQFQMLFQVLLFVWRQINTRGFFLLVVLFLTTLNFLVSRPIKLQWSHQEAYLMRFHWLESVNLFLKTGKILMLPPITRLEDGSPGEDQGYPFILSMLGVLTRIPEMNFGHFIRFNYLLFVSLGVVTSILLYVGFKSLFISSIFYFAYVRTDIYTGGIDHHWMMGAYIPFYLSFLVFFLLRRDKFKPIWFSIYFLIAGIANIVREGDGVIALLLFGVMLIILLFQESYKKHLLQVYQKIGWVLLFILVYSLPWLIISGTRDYRNKIHFDGQTSNMITHHGIWHNAFMGLSYIPNPYGIKWDDSNNLPFVQKVEPKATYMTNEYFAILRQLYFKIMWESPTFWIRNQLAKVATLHEYVASLFPHTYIPVPHSIKPYTFYLLLSVLYFVTQKSQSLRPIFFLTTATLAVTTLPGLIGIPMRMFLRGFTAAYFMMWIMLLALLYTHGSKFFTQPSHV